MQSELVLFTYGVNTSTSKYINILGGFFITFQTILRRNIIMIKSALSTLINNVKLNTVCQKGEKKQLTLYLYHFHHHCLGLKRKLIHG